MYVVVVLTEFPNPKTTQIAVSDPNSLSTLITILEASTHVKAFKVSDNGEFVGSLYTRFGWGPCSKFIGKEMFYGDTKQSPSG